MSKSCPPCTGECLQGRRCPRRRDRMRHRSIIIGLLLVAALWGPLLWLIFSKANHP